METSTHSSSSCPAGIPAYLRLSSEVVEKPLQDQEGECEDFSVVPEPEVPELSPDSPASTSSKSDNEGSDGEMEQGDVDEGFDEEFEFEDKDINEPDPTSHFELGDLDPKELQQLLDDPQLPNLEDFDLGVDVLDSEQAHPILSPSVRNAGSYSPVPSSPYQSNFSPAPGPIDTYYNECNLTQSFCSDPPSVQSNISALSHRVEEELSLAMLATECNMLPDSTSGDPHGSTAETTTPSEYQVPPQPSPVLSTAGGLDLSEASQLLSADTLIELSTALSSDAIVDTQSMYMFGNGSAHLNLSPNNQNTSSVITLLDSAMFPINSEASQTPPSTDRSTTPPSSNRTPVSPRQSSERSVSLSPAPSPKPTESKLSEEDKKLIDMPYYQFRKMLDDPSIPERRKEEIKNIRRKGRNKMAAKVCRTKKLSLIMGLEQEVEQLRKAKSQIAFKTITLEREIAELKNKCHNR